MLMPILPLDVPFQVVIASVRAKKSMRWQSRHDRRMKEKGHSNLKQIISYKIFFFFWEILTENLSTVEWQSPILKQAILLNNKQRDSKYCRKHRKTNTEQVLGTKIDKTSQESDSSIIYTAYLAVPHFSNYLPKYTIEFLLNLF